MKDAKSKNGIISKYSFHLAIFVLMSVGVTAQETKKAEVISYNPNALKDSSKKSIKSAAAGKIGPAKITISYHSPAVRKRVIWGGLVPYDDVWVTGAHSATSITINKPFIIEGKKVAAGKYALFTIPGENQWTVIINKNWQQHLTDDYSAKDDLVRIKIKPLIQDTVTERLQYYIKDAGKNRGKIAVAWEKVRVEFEVVIIDVQSGKSNKRSAK